MNIARWFIDRNIEVSRSLMTRWPNVFGGVNYVAELEEVIRKSIGQRHGIVIAEVGGIDRPLLHRSNRYRYIGVDIEQNARCGALYDRFYRQSIEEVIPEKVDVIVSNTLLEHVKDNEVAFKSMYNSLLDGGVIFHYVPSRWHPYAIALRLVGPVAQRFLIKLLRPSAREVSGYAAFFDRCSPTEMRRTAKAAGFVDVQCTCFFRANDYFSFFLPAFIVVSMFENTCRALGLDVFASGFIVSARRSSTGDALVA